MEAVLAGKGQVLLEGRNRCSTRVPEEEISQQAGQQEMAGAQTHTHTQALITHVHGVISDGKHRQVWATVLLVW